MTEILQKAARILRDGGVVAYPTDTVFGSAADIYNEKAVRRVFSIKKRPLKKPLSLAVNSWPMLERVAKIKVADRKLIAQVFPGAATLVLPKKPGMPGIVTAGKDKVGVRYTRHPLMNDLIEMLKGPIISTSANHHGYPEVINSENIGLPVDFIIPGESGGAVPSAVIDFGDRKILRPGSDQARVSKIMGLRAG